MLKAQKVQKNKNRNLYGASYEYKKHNRVKHAKGQHIQKSVKMQKKE